jgi:hypothetical protein
VEARDRDPQFVALLESAAHLPGAVLVGGSAAILYADHRESRDHDPVVADLADRFEMVLEAVEQDEGWATNRVTPGKVILGTLKPTADRSSRHRPAHLLPPAAQAVERLERRDRGARKSGCCHGG